MVMVEQECTDMNKDCRDWFVRLSEYAAGQDEINKSFKEIIFNHVTDITKRLEAIDGKLSLTVDDKDAALIYARIDKLDGIVMWIIKVLVGSGAVTGAGVGIWKAVS